MGEALEAIGRRAGDEHFPAPDFAIGSVAGAVEREADDRPRERVLGHAGGDVRVMMLHGDERQAALGGPLFGQRGREIAGMQIVRDRLRLDLEGTHEVRERLAEEIEAGEIFKIAQVLALVGEAAAGEGEDIFEMAADGEERRRPRNAAEGRRAGRSRGRGG